MVDKYIGGWATRMVLRGSKSTTGENISLTLPLYAKCVNMTSSMPGPIIGATHVNPADVLTPATASRSTLPATVTWMKTTPM